MCKKVEDQNKAKSNFLTKLRGEDVTKRHAIYEIDREGRADLIGFAALFAEGVMTFFSVDSENKVHCADCVPYPALGGRGVAAYFDGDYAVAC